MVRNIFVIFVISILFSSTVQASLFAESSLCHESNGRVLHAVNDELFTIEVCGEIKVFKELSYCYGVNEGDAVIFDGVPNNCELVSFTVISNGVQCGVMCQ